MDPIPSLEIFESKKWKIDELQRSLKLKHKYFKVNMTKDILTFFMSVYFEVDRHKKEPYYITNLLTSIDTNPYVLDFLLNTEETTNLVFFLNDKIKDLFYDELIEECNKKLIFKKHLGSGSYGNVDEVCVNLNGGCYVMKLQNLEDNSKEFQNIFWNEVTILKYLNGVAPTMAPTIYAAWLCNINKKKYGVIIMEKLDGTLTEFNPNKKHEKKILDNLVHTTMKMINELNALKIVHGDLKFQNILFDSVNGHTIKIGDWGLSKCFNKYGNVYPRFNVFIVDKIFKEEFYAPMKKFNMYYDLYIFMYETLIGREYSVLPVEYSKFFLEGKLYEQLRKYDSKRFYSKGLTKKIINDFLKKAIFAK